MNHDYSYAGPVRTIVLERSLVMKTGFSRKEAARTFAGKMEMDDTGQVLEISTLKKRTVFKYDSYGNPVEEIRFTGEGEILAQEVSQYGSNGMLLRKDTLNSVGDPVESIRYSFDQEREMVVEHSSNRVVMRKYDSTGKLVLECIYIDERLDMIVNYDYKGDLLVEKIYKDSTDKIIRHFFYEYGERGLLIREKCINADKTVTTHNVYEYDDHDKYNWLKRTTFAVQEDSKRVKEIPIEVLYREISYGKAIQTSRRKETEEEISGVVKNDIKKKESVLMSDSSYDEPEPPMPVNQFAKLSIEQPTETWKADSAVKSLEYPLKEPLIESVPVKERELRFPNGIYRGEINGDKMEGKGVFIYDNGDRYEGLFRNGKLNGQGIMLWADGRSYTGEFKDGALHGEGECHWANGDIYRGEFKESKMHGRGVFRWSDGSVFEGLFENNQRTRQGMIADLLPDKQ